MKIVGHAHLEDAFECGLYPLLDLLELLLVFESCKAEFGLLLVAFLLHLLLRTPEFPAKLIALFLFRIFLLLFFADLYLLLLQEGEDVGGRFDSEVEILEGIDFDIFDRKQFVYFLVQSCTLNFIVNAFLVLQFEMLVHFVCLLFLQEVVVEFVDSFEGEQVFDRQVAHHFLFEFGVVKNELQLWVFEVDHFFWWGRFHLVNQSSVPLLQLSGFEDGLLFLGDSSGHLSFEGAVGFVEVGHFGHDLLEIVLQLLISVLEGLEEVIHL